MALIAASFGAGCGDQTPAFCESLDSNADLDALVAALDARNLELASAEAQRFKDLADLAPIEIRRDLIALADAVVDIVEMLGEDTQSRSAEALNAKMSDLDRRSVTVSDWALSECGISLE